MAFGRFFEGIRERIVGPEAPLPPRVESDVPRITKAPLNTIRENATQYFTQLEQDNLNAENQQAAALAQAILQSANPADAFRAAFTPGAAGSPEQANFDRHLALRNVDARPSSPFRAHLFEQIVLNFIGHDAADPNQLPDAQKLAQLFNPAHAAFGSVPGSIRRLIGDPGDPGDPTAVPPRPARPATPGTHPELSRSLRNAFEIQQALGTRDPVRDLGARVTAGNLNLAPADLRELRNSVRQTELFLHELGWDFTMLGGTPGAPGPGGRPGARVGGLNQPSNPEEAARLRTAGSVACKHRFDYHNHVHQWRQARRDRDRGVITRDEAQRIMDEQRILANNAWIAFESNLHDVKSHFLIDSLHRKMRSRGMTEEQILAANDPRQFGMLIASDINRLYANIENMRRLEHLPIPGEEFEIRERSVWKALLERWNQIPAPARFAVGLGISTGVLFAMPAAFAGLASLFPAGVIHSALSTLGVWTGGGALAKYGALGAATMRTGRFVLGAGIFAGGNAILNHIFSPRRIEQRHDQELQTLLQNNQEALLRDPAARRDLMRHLDENRLKMRRELSDKMKTRGRWGMALAFLIAPALTATTAGLIEAAGNHWASGGPHTPGSTAPATPGSGTGVHHPPGTPGATPPGTHGPGSNINTGPGIKGILSGINPQDLAKDPLKFLGAADKTYTIRSGDNFFEVLKDHNVFGLSTGDSDYAWKHTMVQSGLDGKLHPLGDMSLTHPGDRVHLIKLPDGYHYVITPDSHQPLGHTAGYHAEVLENKNQPPPWMEKSVHGHNVNHFPGSHDTPPSTHHGGRGGHHMDTNSVYGGDPYGGNVYDTGTNTGKYENWNTGQTVDTPPPTNGSSHGGGTPPTVEAPDPATTPGLGQPERLPSKTGLEPFKQLTVDQYIGATKNGVSAGIGADAAAQAQAAEFTQHSAHHRSLAGVLTEHLNTDISKTDTVEQALRKLNINPRN